jgi:monoterpene epsilon-lactone hydrolase
MSQQQQDALDTMLRDGPLDVGGDVAEQRQVFEQMMSQVPAPEGVTTSAEPIGGIDALTLTVEDASDANVILYFHGGAFAIGTAAASVPLAGDLAVRARTNLVSVDYRLAPEHAFPAGLDDAIAAYAALLSDGLPAERIIVAGESAGAGLVASLLLALRDRGRPLPAAALLMSPWADLTLAGDSITAKQAVDPALTRSGLSIRTGDYAAGRDLADPLLSPVFGDFTGLPPLLVQVGSHEILLSDAVRLAERAGLADVQVTLEVVAGVPHVFQSFAAMLDEGSDALDRAAAFISEHLPH